MLTKRLKIQYSLFTQVKEGSRILSRKILITGLLLLGILTTGIEVYSQTAGDFQTSGNVTFAAAGNWERYNGAAWVAAGAAPNSTNGVITIRNGHTATANGNVTLDQVVVAAGGILTVNGGVTLTIANGAGTDMAVDGTLSNAGTITTTGTLVINDGGTYAHNRNGGNLPTATWGASSNCVVTGITNAAPGGISQSFGNFTWNCTGQGTNNLDVSFNNGTVIQGDFTVSSTGTTGSIILSNNANKSMTITGDLIISGGILDMLRGGNGRTQTLYLGGDLTMTGGTLTETNTNGGSEGSIFFNGTTTQFFSKTAGTIINTIYFTVNSGATLDIGTSVISGSGTFTLNSGASIITANTSGLASTGATGSIQVTGTRTYNAGANYIYNGTSAQVIGTGPTAANSLTIDNAAGVTLSNNFTVSNALNLNNGNLSLGSANYNLTIGVGASIATTAGFDNSHMIVCDGTGSLVRQGTTNANYNMVYPVGTGTYYTPMELASFTASDQTGSISVRAVAGSAPGINPTDLQKYWVVSTTGLTITSTDIRFTYVYPGEEGPGGDQASYIPYIYNGTTWSIPSGSSAGGAIPLSVTGTNNITGTWTGREGPATYYSYQSGDWASPSTWTKDPSGTLSVDPAVPGSLDRIIILNGRTVHTTTGYTVLSAQINDGGVLDLRATTGHNFGTVSGQGRLKLQTYDFPGGTFTNFIAAGGGTVEYYSTANFDFSQLVYNNLIINLSNSGLIATLLGNMTINGDLTITQGRFQINNNAGGQRTVTIEGDVSVDANGFIQLGSGNYNHTFTVRGDFTNNGRVDFYELNAPDYFGDNVASAHADVEFDNDFSDQNLICNGYSEFYRIGINKGTDWTYTLNIEASNSSNFLLYGPNNNTHAADGDLNSKALGLTAGTLRLGTNIIIYGLTSPPASTNNYDINSIAQLIIDGASVSTAHTPSDMAVVVYGKLMINDGIFDASNTRASVITRATSNVTINGGTFTATQLRTSNEGGTHRGAFIMTGGTLNLITNTASLSWQDNSRRHATLSFTYPDNVFVMSGGTINILGSTPQIDDDGGIDGFNYSLVLGANPENVSVTGGTINITIPTIRPAYITSTAPFWNLNIIGTNVTNAFGIRDFNVTETAPTSVTAKPLIVKNNLILQNLATFDNATNTQDVTIGGNFIINAGTSYIPANNTTMLNGLSGQLLDNTGTIGSGGLYNFTLSNSSNTSITQNLIIRNNLTINSNCFFQDMGKTVRVAGNIVNSGTHSSQAGGGIMLNGGGAQTIGGSGNGVFGNLIINKIAGTTALIAEQSITGNLRLASGLLDISTHKLSFGATSNIYDALYPATTAVFSGTKMIRTSGNQSDGGITKNYNSTSAFLFPIGTASDYTPATIQFNSAPFTWGAVNIKPVAQYEPFVTSSNSLNYYWKVTQTGISGIPPNSISHTYHFIDADTIGRGIENNYIPGVYNPFSWTYINDIGQVASNDIHFNNVSYLSGDFTAGEIDAFNPVTVYYSRTTGDWNVLSTWSTTSNSGPADATVLPGPDDPVIIGDGGTNNHVVTIPAGFNNVVVGGLQINSGSILDITTTTGHNFGAIPDTKISGTGTLKISSAAATATFPGGDFGNFLTTGGGTVEYYTNALDFTIPASKLYYNNLTLSPGNGRFISMPDNDLSVYGNYVVNGTGTGIARLNSTGARTMTVSGNINIIGGTLQYYNGTPQTVLINGDLNISGGAFFNVRNGGTAVTNLLSIYGNLNNDGTFDMFTSATLFANVSFFGNTNKVISGTGTNDFNILTVNKGSSRNTILDVTADNLDLSYTGGAALVLTNGTFRVSNSSLNFILSTSSPFTIPITAALSVNDGSVTIGTSNNAGDLILAGRLEVMNNGIVNIGNGGNFNNDIEYASGGDPEIIISGSGILNVNGQIRRGLTITSGSLIYSQSGGAVTVSGRNDNTARAKFEVLNSGSEFNMSGGTLSIVNGGGVNFGDVLITPEANNVTGGTIQLGTGATATTAFKINSNSPIWNLTVDATTNTKTSDLQVNTLDIQNNLTINGNSVFRTNGLNVSIGGNLTNNNNNAAVGLTNGGYQPGTSTQSTTFDGSGAQIIQGLGANLTNFANLTISATGSVTLASNSNLQVNKNLSLLSGTFSDGSNTITVLGNIENNAIHTSPNTSGGIVLAGSQIQTISGNGLGEFGNVQLNNSTGIEMIDNSVINGQLTFTNGYLYIDDYLLTFGLNATIGGFPGVNRMIMLNGVISDQGVKKIYPASAADFTFPIGVAGKYTPARYNITANGATGTILVKPVNYKHPSTYEDLAATNELQYYWYAVSTGFSGLSVNHEYYYDNDDALPDETDYVVGRYIPSTFSWEAPSEGTVYPASDYFDISGVNYIYGEYTCGVNIAPSPNFQNIPVYYSRNATNGGNWTNPGSWTLNSDGSDCNANPDCVSGHAPSYPQGNAVVILPGHTIVMNADGQIAYSVDLTNNVSTAATLEVGNTIFHSLGHIRGGGKLGMTSTTSGSFIFPAGVYDEFLANTLSTIEFNNNSATPATLPLKPGNDYKPYQNVIFSGSGIKYMSAENMRILGDLTINGGTLNNTLHNRTLTLLGDWTDNTTSSTGGFVPGTGRVVFAGTSAQNLTITNAGTIEQFYNFQINNAAGVTLEGGGKVDVNRNLYLTLGNINTDAANLLSLTYTSTSTVIGGGSTSFVNGPLQKRINSGSYFNFPIGNGNGTRYGNLYVSSVTATGDYIAQYYNHNPGNDGYNPLSLEIPIDAVSNLEYWSLSGIAADANVRIRWDSQSGIIPVDAPSRQKLRIVEWSGSLWQSVGNVIVDGGVNSGTIQTNPVVSTSGTHFFTIGAESLPTATIVSGDSAICDDGSSTSIAISLTGTPPWTIKYKINGGYEKEIDNIASSPFPLAVSNTLEPLATQGPGDYEFNVSYVKDSTGATGIRNFTSTVTITLNESPNPLILGNSTVDIGETGVEYRSGTSNIPGHTYSWTVSGGASIASGQGTYRITVDWPSISGDGWVQLTETVIDGGCFVTTEQYEVEITDIPNPNVTGIATVCLNQRITYRTNEVGTHTYEWSLPSGGGSIIGSNNLDTVVISWTSTGPYLVQVSETGSTTVTDDLAVTVNPVPSNANAVSDPEICADQNANIIISGTAAGINYRLYLQSDDTPVGSPLSSGPGGDLTIVATPDSSTNYYLVATNEYFCSAQLTDIASVTVNQRPVPIITGADTTCVGNTIAYETESGMSDYSWTITSGSGTINAPGNTYNITVEWSSITGQYQDRILSVEYTDEHGCTTENATEITIRVFRVPETGPSYHIPN